MKIRLGVGHSWRGEAQAEGGPRDAFIFEVDGVNLVPEAVNESLLHVVSGLLDAVSALAVQQLPGGDVSLEDSHLELCLWRRPGHEVELSIVDLRAGVVRPRPMRLELPALVEAAMRCGRDLLRALPAEAWPTERRGLEKRLAALGGVVIDGATAGAEVAWRAERGERGDLRFIYDDVEGRAGRWARRAPGGLAYLLAPGTLEAGGAAVTGWPMLGLMRLARAASDGPQPLGEARLSPEAIFGAGLELCLSLRAHNPALASNPWLGALEVRCADGLKALRAPTPDLTPAPSSPGRPKAPGPPLATTGALRRVVLEERWSRPTESQDEGAQLKLARALVLVQSAGAVHAFDAKGRTRFRHEAPRGVAVGDTGRPLIAGPERLFYFGGRGASATWFRHHDGSALGSDLTEVGGVLVVGFGRHGASGFDALTGRERWRFDPPRTQRSHLSVLGPRVYVGTDAGALYAIDPADGQVRFRVRASLPCVWPALQYGALVVMVLSRGEHTVVFGCAPTSKRADEPAGALRWTTELALSTPCPPVADRSRLFLAGARDGRTFALCIGARGQVLWERALPCDAHSVRLLAWERGLVASDARGVCVRLSPDGEVRWVLGGSDDELSVPVAPTCARQVLVVPGPVVRLVHPGDGRVLAELPKAPRLNGLAVTRRLDLYAHTEPGTLTAYAVGSTLSVL